MNCSACGMQLPAGVIYCPNCGTCGMQLPAGVIYCPNCGTPTPAYYAPTGASPDNPTVSSSSANVPPPPPPYTNYGSQPYGVQSPYSTPPPNPYNTPLPASYISNGEAQFVPPPPSQRRSNRTGLIIGVVVEETEGGYCGYIHPYYQRGIFTYEL